MAYGSYLLGMATQIPHPFRRVNVEDGDFCSGRASGEYTSAPVETQSRDMGFVFDGWFAGAGTQWISYVDGILESQRNSARSCIRKFWHGLRGPIKNCLEHYVVYFWGSEDLKRHRRKLKQSLADFESELALVELLTNFILYVGPLLWLTVKLSDDPPILLELTIEASFWFHLISLFGSKSLKSLRYLAALNGRPTVDHLFYFVFRRWQVKSQRTLIQRGTMLNHILSFLLIGFSHLSSEVLVKADSLLSWVHLGDKHSLVEVILVLKLTFGDWAKYGVWLLLLALNQCSFGDQRNLTYIQIWNEPVTDIRRHGLLVFFVRRIVDLKFLYFTYQLHFLKRVIVCFDQMLIHFFCLSWVWSFFQVGRRPTRRLCTHEVQFWIHLYSLKGF